MSVADAINRQRASAARVAPTALPDLCTISTPGASTVDDYGNATNTPSSISSVPCKYEALSAFEQSRAGSVAAFATHAIKLPMFWNGEVVTVGANASILVAARDPYPALSFTVTGQLSGSVDVWLRVAAKLEV